MCWRVPPRVTGSDRSVRCRSWTVRVGLEWGPESCSPRTVRVRSAERSVLQGGEKWAPRGLPAWKALRVPINSWKLTVTHLIVAKDDSIPPCEIITFSANGDDTGILPALGALEPWGAFSCDSQAPRIIATLQGNTRLHHIFLALAYGTVNSCMRSTQCDVKSNFKGLDFSMKGGLSKHCGIQAGKRPSGVYWSFPAGRVGGFSQGVGSKTICATITKFSSC